MRTAGDGTLLHFQQNATVDLKGDDSPVTVADQNAERLMRQLLSEQFPGESVLGEEEGLTGSGDDRWVLDPIDGTKSFISGVPLYATLLSYEQDGQPILGVVYLPALGEMFWAERGGGAFCNGIQIQVSNETDLKRVVMSTGSPTSLEKYGRLEGAMSIARQVMACRTWSDAYGHILLASGRIQMMLDPVVSRWDISAVIPIVEEAGGVAMKFNGGKPLNDPAQSGDLELVSVTPGLKDLVTRTFQS
ncbi:MAG: hypothetical protein KF824_11795 [Fimbriimonadaceae bacterium]|nr:MAG: hypothetical protein KF824_11795 [Fimbriimonadaceae bacterium]